MKSLCVAGVLVVVAWGALAFGAVYPWAYEPLLIGCAIIGVFGLAIGGWPPHQWPVLAALGAICLASAIQLVPLPETALNRISPGAEAFRAEYYIADAFEGAGAPASAVAAGEASARGLTRRHPLSIDPRSTLLGLVFLGTFTMFLAGLLSAMSRYGIVAIGRGIVILGVALAIIGIVQKATLGDNAYEGMKIYGFWAPRNKLTTPFGPFVNKNHYAGWMLMALPLAFGLLASTIEEARDGGRGWRNRVIWLSSSSGGQMLLSAFAVVIMGLALLTTVSRSGIVGFGLIVLMTGWVTARALPRRSARIATGLLFAGLFAIPALWLGMDSAASRFATASESVQLRIDAWRDGVEIVRDFPLAGAGLNTYGTATILYRSSSRGVHFREAHNDYLQLLAEGGLLLGVPIALAVLAMGYTIRRQFRERRENGSTYWLRVGAVTGLIAIALQSLVEFSLQMPGNAVLFVVLAGMAMTAPRSTMAGHARTRTTDA